jgi:protein-tyrosine-phosphatase
LLGNRKDIEVASAGVHAVRGQPPSLYAVQVCEEEGVDISGLRSQPLTAALIDQATHIFAMTGAHLETIQLLFPDGAEKSFLLREFEEPDTTVWRDVPDQSVLAAMFTKSAPAPSKTLYRACLRS